MKKNNKDQGKGLLKGLAEKFKNPFKKKEARIEILEEIDGQYDLSAEEYPDLPDENMAFEQGPPSLEDLVNNDTNDEEYHISESEEARGLEQTLPNRNFNPDDLDAVNLNEEDYEDEATDPSIFQEMKGPPKESNHIQNLLHQGKSSFKELLTRKKIESSAKKRKEGPALNLPVGPLDFSFDNLVDAIFSLKNRPKWHKVFIACLLVTICYQTGKYISIIISNKIENMASSGLGGGQFASPPPPMSNSNITKIAEANLFNAKLNEQVTAPIDEKKPIIANINCREATRVTSLPITLLNTVVLQDSVKSTASVQIRGQQEAVSLREGEKVGTMAEIGKINRLSVVLKNLQSGQCEIVKNNDDQPPRTANPIKVLSPEQGKKAIAATKKEGIENQGNSFKIKKNVREQMLGNISEVLTQARAVQIRNADGSFSFKMTEIVPGSIYSQLGIQNDDIITAIDGKKITNLNEVMSMFGRIKDIDNLSISVQRNGADTNMDYNFED